MDRLTRFTHEGLTFEVTDAGPAQGRPTLLLHGFPQDRTAWDGVVPALHTAGLRTLAPDLRGYSPGARPAARQAYTLSRIAGDALALLDAAGVEQAHVVGHDWGGALAWVLAGLHPQRVASLTVLSTPHPAAMVTAFGTSSQGLRSWYMVAFQLPWLPERLLARDPAPALRRSGLPAAAAEHYAGRLREAGLLSGALGWYRAMPWNLREQTPPSPVPTTYVWGRKDFALGRAAAEATAAHVRGDYVFVELDAGHWLPEARPAEVARAVTERVVGSSR